MRFGGVFLLNEIDLLDPSTAAGLNSILDGTPLCIPENGGELITPHPIFRLCATANSNGGSDSSGLYAGVLRQNLAFMDRFVLCEVGYPSPEAEESLLARVTLKLPDAVRKKMVEPALSGEQIQEIRTKLKSGAEVAALAREYRVSRQTIYSEIFDRR